MPLCAIITPPIALSRLGLRWGYIAAICEIMREFPDDTDLQEEGCAALWHRLRVAAAPAGAGDDDAAAKTHAEACVGCLLGAFIGDALGAPVELSSAAAIRADPLFAAGGVRHMVSICCSPPESVTPSCWRRSPRRGNSS